MSSRCAVCKHTRKRCPADCLFAPHFPGDNMERFHIVRRFFGVKQLSYILNSVLPNQREDVMKSIVLDAERRQAEPVYGNPGAIFQLERQIEEITLQINNTRSIINSNPSSSLGMTLTYPSSSMGVYHGLPLDNRAPVDNSFWESVSLNGLGQLLTIASRPGYVWDCNSQHSSMVSLHQRQLFCSMETTLFQYTEQLLLQNPSSPVITNQLLTDSKDSPVITNQLLTDSNQPSGKVWDWDPMILANSMMLSLPDDE